eukprot:Hpha_TRINITY_DN20989_c0_g1::TRINITY_DN20989_c0_g1_i1::g.139698::m.139698
MSRGSGMVWAAVLFGVLLTGVESIREDAYDKASSACGEGFGDLRELEVAITACRSCVENPELVYRANDAAGMGFTYCTGTRRMDHDAAPSSAPPTEPSTLHPGDHPREEL